MVSDKNKRWYIIGSAMAAFITYMFVGPRLVKDKGPSAPVSSGINIPPSPIPAEQGGLPRRAPGSFDFYPENTGILGPIPEGWDANLPALKSIANPAYASYNTRLIVS